MDADLLRFMATQRARVREQLHALSERARKRRETQFELRHITAAGTRVFRDVEYPRDTTQREGDRR